MQTSFTNILKKIAPYLLLCIPAFLFYYCNTVIYGIKQGYGQFHILYKAKPVEKVLNDAKYPDSLKQKLRLVQEIRQFGIDSIGLNNTKNYTTIYNQKGKPILWLVIASKPYKLEAYEWSFPIVGSFAYKGFFCKTDAISEAGKLMNKNFDVRIGTVSAWSTLGYFKDPILSNVLFRNEGMLAQLIIHELTHATIFIKDSSQFNENLATFVGEEGAKMFLVAKYGRNAKQYKNYIGELSDDRKFADHIVRGCAQLDSLYAGFTNDHTDSAKLLQKTKLIKHIVQSADTLSFYDTTAYQNIIHGDKLPNNAYFIGFRMYHNDQNRFNTEFRQKFNSDFKSYLQYLKNKYTTD